MRDIIAVCLVRANEEFQCESLRAIYSRAREYGLFIRVFNTFEELSSHNANDQGEESIFERIDYNRLCGMILFCEKIKDDELNNSLIKKGRENHIPVVVLDRDIDSCNSIVFDYSNAFETIVRHLLEEHKCRSFFVMAGIRNNAFSDERINVVRRVAAEYGVEIKDDDIGYGDFWDVPCRKEMNRFLASGRPLPDAFIALNDLMAINICEVLHQAGYRVPQDTIVTGFDGIEEERYSTPRLTTAQQDIAAGGRHAVDIIRQVMQGNSVERKTVIPFEVRYSQSCGCLPMGENDSSEKVQDLFFLLKGYRQFTKYMYDMMDEIAGTRTIEGVLDKLPSYLIFLESFQHMYLCLENGYLAAFDDLTKRIMQCNRSLNNCKEIDMVLVAEWHFGKGFEIPLLHFDRKDLLPRERECEITNYLMFIPLHMQDMVIGYLAVDFDPYANDYSQMRNFSISLSHILDSVRSHQQMLNFNQKLISANDKLEELYIHDPLTGIYNRRGFYQNIVDWIGDHDYGWIMVVSADLNGLKEINDTHGHSEGDFAIQTFGRSLDKCVAESGICARFGGDEFSAAVFYAEYEPEAEQNFRTRLMKLLDDVNNTAGKGYQITCSCGIQIASCHRNINIDDLLKKADQKMYRDKRQFYAASGQTEKKMIH